jgi:hypothetical protein
MNFQYISDKLGNKTAVIIPINYWEKIPKEFKEQFNEPYSEMSSDEFLEWIENAEKSPTISLKDFNNKWEQKKQQILKLIP